MKPACRVFRFFFSCTISSSCGVSASRVVVYLNFGGAGSAFLVGYVLFRWTVSHAQARMDAHKYKGAFALPKNILQAGVVGVRVFPSCCGLSLAYSVRNTYHPVFDDQSAPTHLCLHRI